MKLAYLINRYPMATLTFIRREIAAHEAAGTPVHRFTIRPTTGEIVDPGDRAEAEQTRVILDAGLPAIVLATARRAVTAPIRFAKALLFAVRLSHRSARGLAVHLAYFVEACVLQQWLQDDEITHLHVHFGTNSTTVALLCRALGGPPFSFTVHGQEEFDRPEALKLREKVAAASLVAAVSDYGRAQVQRWCDPHDWPKIHVVRCGVDDIFLSPPPGRESGSQRFLCVSRFDQHKGQTVLIEAAARLLAEGRKFEVVLAGDGPLRAQIEGLIAACPDPDAILVPGWQDNGQIRDLILESRATVLPSFAEGQPLAIIESFALGRPVIASRVGGIGELVDETCGWLVPPSAVEPLVEAMREVLDAAPEELAEMGRIGAARVRERHDASREAAVLRSLLSTTDGGGSGQLAPGR